MKKINLSISGCMGRMGRQLIISSKKNKNFKLVSLTENLPVNKKLNDTNALKSNPKCLLVVKKNTKIPRNEKCPATGKKYKHCCGAL